ncbi:MAG: SDR family NAD(P)-dependent oxidoreductase [Leptonema sp. (in: bacteria)]
MKSILITGTSRGLGHDLAKIFLEKGYMVIGLSRNSSSLIDEYPDTYKHIYFDLNHLNELSESIHNFFDKTFFKFFPIEMETLVLNAGVLGKIQEIQNTTLKEIETIMNVNVWSNKILIDTFLEMEKKLKIQGLKYVLSISSGASIKGDKGWSGYALSKATLNMLIKLYAKELPEKKFISLAPGLVLTKMQDEIYYQNIDLNNFPSFIRLIEAREKNQMQTPEETAQNIFTKWEEIFSNESGTYVDIRNI